MLQLFRQQNFQRKLPPALRREIDNHKCRDCEENAQLPRVPRISLPAPTTSNLAVTLDVMYHDIYGKQAKILVMLDAGDMMLRLRHLSDDSAKEAFTAYFSRWISIFDSPPYTIVDRGRNLTNNLMCEQLRKLQSQLCPIPTEAPWSIGTNERSHGFIHRSIDKLSNNRELNQFNSVELVLSEVEMAWNFVQHKNNSVPHYHRFGQMPRQLGEQLEFPTVRERVALMELAREHTEQMRAEHTILRALNKRYRHVTEIKVFKVNDDVWFHRSKYGWRKGTVVSVSRPTVNVQHENKIFPTHENRIRPFFGEFSIPPELANDDHSSHGIIDKPSSPTNNIIDHTKPTDESASETGKITIPELLNNVFTVYNPLPEINSTILTDDNIIRIQTDKSNRGIIDSQIVFHTEIEHIKNIHTKSINLQFQFFEAMRDEIEFLMKETIKTIKQEDIHPECELQPLKWILSIKRSPNSNPPIRYRARLVSASNRTQLRHSVHGNSPTVALHTVRILMTIFPTWHKSSASTGNQLKFFTRDVTKAFLQSNPSKRLVYYQPPPEFYKLFPALKNKIWLAKTQLYGDVEAGLYWNKTFIPWLCNNILDLKQSIYDPSLLYSPSSRAAMILCTDDTGNVMNTDQIKEEEKIPTRFTCRERQFLPIDFKGIDIIEENGTITLSQDVYASKMDLKNKINNSYSKLELQRELNQEETKMLRSDAGKLAWLATGTSPLSAFHASVALQSNKNNPRTIQILISTHRRLNQVKNEKLTSIKYLPLHNDSIHIRLYSDGAYQNLKTKHSQIGFIVALSDKNDTFNMVHWHSARAPRRPSSTEESETMTLDSGIKTIRNMRNIIFQILKREVPIVCYIDNETLWTNLMNSTVTSMPEVTYRCREAIHDEFLNSICLIPGSENPADAMTKQNDNKKMHKFLIEGAGTTTPTRVFMLQTSKYRNATYIPTTKVPMVTELKSNSTSIKYKRE